MLEFEEGRKGLRRLIYSSRFVGEGDFGEAVRAIVATSIQNNRLVDVTGFLLAGEGLFLQWLEGPATAVEETFARIARDKRHADLVTIADSPAERRRFRDWNMGQHRLGAADQALLAEVGLEVFNPAGLEADRAERLLLRVGERYLRSA
uniref:BLUF domain-containing protein n=1 Tax=uncultured Caulobacter sp. TaxID=158749 RepID=UPI0025E6B905|nr:BLUF domain-containing protein [uncultured Caulobacter sp.]